MDMGPKAVAGGGQTPKPPGPTADSIKELRRGGRDESIKNSARSRVTLDTAKTNRQKGNTEVDGAAEGSRTEALNWAAGSGGSGVAMVLGMAGRH